MRSRITKQIGGCGLWALAVLVITRAKGGRHVAVPILCEGWHANASTFTEREGDQRS